MSSWEYCGIFKITCFEERLRTVASARCYLFGFCTVNCCKIFVSEQKYKNILKNCVSQKKYLQFSCNVYVKFYYKILWGFTKILKVKICVFRSVLSSTSENTGPVTRDHFRSHNQKIVPLPPFLPVKLLPGNLEPPQQIPPGYVLGLG